jgi:hypothetical protein
MWRWKGGGEVCCGGEISLGSWRRGVDRGCDRVAIRRYGVYVRFMKIGE